MGPFCYNVLMATEVYLSENIKTLDNIEIEISPLKIKYLKEFMGHFSSIKESQDDQESISVLVECARICMKQFYPTLSKTTDDIENNFDLPTIYKIIDISTGIKINEKSEEPIKEQANDNKTTWSDLDLAKIESEVFLLGIWKDYDELEKSMSMPELTSTLEAKRDMEYQERKFLAAMQGVDLDKETKQEEDPWTKLKNKVFNSGKDDKDILTFKGDKARRAGFGIGMGLDYEDLRTN